MGVYLISAYDLDFPGNKVDVDFYVWYNTNKDSLNLTQYFELVNAVDYQKTGETNEVKGNSFYQTLKIDGKLRKSWEVANFPFDKQTIEIIIEDYDKDNTELIFIPDTIASKMDKDLKIDGWKISDFKIKSVNHTYESNYGDPSIPINEYATYSRVIISFNIEREGNGLFFKLFVGLFISVLIALITFFIDPTDLDPRFGLPVGGIFAAIASEYVITSTLPQNQTLTLVDILHNISFIYIFICLLSGVIALSLKKKGHEMLQLKMDKIIFYSLASTYLILTVYFIFKAIP